MKKLFASIFIITMLFSCSKSIKPNKDKALDEKFDKYKAGFVIALWQINPDWAAAVGYHKFDNLLVIPDATADKKQLDFVNAQLDSLKKYPIEDIIG